MNKLQMAAKLYDARDSLKSLFPAEFKERTANMALAIKRVMEMSQLSELEAMIRLMKSQEGNPMVQMWLMAAVVEMMEPSEAVRG